MPDRSADVIVSNCVINLSPDKAAVFREAFRALRAGGRLAISDIVASAPLPEHLRNDAAALSGCVAGAPPMEELRALLTEAGFVDVRIDLKPESKSFIKDWMPGSGAEGFVASAAIQATKPEGTAEVRYSAGYATFAETFSGWRNSDQKSLVMSGTSVTRAGIAVVYEENSPYGVYWVVIVG